jgi:hypothetical protein
MLRCIGLLVAPFGRADARNECPVLKGRADLARDALLVRAGVGTGQDLVGHCLDRGRVDADHRRANSLELSSGCRSGLDADPHRMQSIALLRATPWVK